MKCIVGLDGYLILGSDVGRDLEARFEAATSFELLYSGKIESFSSFWTMPDTRGA